MSIHIASDIHLEFGHVPTLHGGDLLLLCGDTIVASHISEHKTDADSRSHRKRYAKFFSEQVSKYARVLVLMGNHEHYGMVIEDTAHAYRKFLAEHAPNAKLLDDEVEIIEGTAFIGSTLWSPCMKKDDPYSEIYIRDGMNDFRRIRTRAKSHNDDIAAMTLGRRITTEDIRARHNKHVAWLKRTIPKHENVVVMTHHAPSFQSNTKYQQQGRVDGDVLTPAYCSDQEKLIRSNPHISHWVHGHTHVDARYMVGSTCVLTNQHGYWGHERIADEFDVTRNACEIDAITVPA